MANITPTVGRVVWFHHGVVDNTLFVCGAQPMAATVAFVNDDGTVNLSVSDHMGVQHNKQSVPLVQDGYQPKSGMWCEWMPYQRGQAAKTEALEQKLEGGAQ